MADTASGSTADKSVQVKLVLLGEAAVGKSSVVLRFVGVLKTLTVCLSHCRFFVGVE